MSRFHLIVRMAATLFSSGVPAFAQTPPPAPPPFPIGSLTAYPTVIQTAVKPTLVWSTDLPAGANAGDHVFFIRQTQLPDLIQHEMIVAGEGEQMSTLAINPGSARFELWAVKVSTAEEYLLDSTIVGAYLPMAGVAICTEDPYRVLPRTRADRPFFVDVTVSGIIGDEHAPDSSKGVTLTRHGQSYGPAGTGAGLERSQATLLDQSEITSNGTQTLSFAVHAIPGTDSAKMRGEERFTVLTREDEWTPVAEIDSGLIQIWPVADGTITGIAEGQAIDSVMPALTFQLDDLYPDSTTHAQVYKGGPRAGVTGTVVPGTSVTVNDSVPANRTLVVSDYGSVFDSDGPWTLELLTRTPFGTDRLAHVSFTVQGLGMTVEGWRQIHFGSTANDGDGADLHDYDHDGLPNLIEFAFGFDPKQGSAGLLPSPQRIGDDLVIQVTPPDDVKGITYGAEWSTTLLPDSWSAVADSGEAPEHCFRVSTTGQPRLYLRLKVTAP